jgi:hypothetical protein
MVQSCGRLMQKACGSVILESPIIFIQQSSYKNSSLGTFKYNLVKISGKQTASFFKCSAKNVKQ